MSRLLCVLLACVLLASFGLILGQQPDGLSSTTAALSCYQIAQYRSSLGQSLTSAVFWLYYVNNSVKIPYQTWCDFSDTTDSKIGGWTLMAKTLPNEGTNFRYDSELWTNNSTVFQTEQINPSIYSEAKVESFNTLPVNQVKLVFQQGSSSSSILLSLSSRNTLVDIFSNPYSTLFASDATSTSWLSLVNNGQLFCSKQGFNLQSSNIQLRLGFLASTNDSCSVGANTQDFFIGLGSSALPYSGSGFVPLPSSSCVNASAHAIDCSSTSTYISLYGRTYFGSNCSLYNYCSGMGDCVETGTCQCYNSNDLTSDCSGVKCYGIPATSPSVCNNQAGTCTKTNTCQCTPGWTGERCQIPICYDILANQTGTVCSGHGSCIAPDTCFCFNSNHWTGPNCNITSCNEIGSNEPLVCSGQGNCIAKNLCQCHNTTFTGSDCQFSTQCAFADAIPSNCDIRVSEFLIDQYGSYMTATFVSENVTVGILDCAQLFDEMTFEKIGGNGAICQMLFENVLKVTFGWTATLQPVDEYVTVNYLYPSEAVYVTRYFRDVARSNPLITTQNSSVITTSRFCDEVTFAIDVPFETRQYTIQWFVNGGSDAVNVKSIKLSSSTTPFSTNYISVSVSSAWGKFSSRTFTLNRNAALSLQYQNYWSIFRTESFVFNVTVNDSCNPVILWRQTNSPFLNNDNSFIIPSLRIVRTNWTYQFALVINQHNGVAGYVNIFVKQQNFDLLLTPEFTSYTTDDSVHITSTIVDPDVSADAVIYQWKLLPMNNILSSAKDLSLSNLLPWISTSGTYSFSLTACFATTLRCNTTTLPMYITHLAQYLLLSSSNSTVNKVIYTDGFILSANVNTSHPITTQQWINLSGNLPLTAANIEGTTSTSMLQIKENRLVLGQSYIFRFSASNTRGVSTYKDFIVQAIAPFVPQPSPSPVIPVFSSPVIPQASPIVPRFSSPAPPIVPRFSSPAPHPVIPGLQNLTVSLEGLPSDRVISSNNVLTLFANTQNGYGTVEYEWSLFLWNREFWQFVPLDNSNVIGPTNINLLIFKANYFLPGAEYRLQLTVKDSAYRQIRIEEFIYINEAPSGGASLIEPPTGQELVTLFTLRAVNWTDDESSLRFGNSTLRFSFSYLNEETGLQVALTDRSPYPNVSIPLPAGNPNTNYSIAIIYRVYDLRGAFTEGQLSVQVKPLQFDDANAKLTFLGSSAANQISNALSSGNLDVAAVSTLIVSNYLKDGDSDPTIIERKKQIKAALLANLKSLTDMSLQQQSTSTEKSQNSQNTLSNEFVKRQVTILDNVASNSAELTTTASSVSSTVLQSTLSNSDSQSLEKEDAEKVVQVLSSISTIQFSSTTSGAVTEMQQQDICLSNLDQFNSNLQLLLMQFGKGLPPSNDLVSINSSLIQVQSLSQFSSLLQQQQNSFVNDQQQVIVSQELLRNMSASEFSKLAVHVVYYSQNRYGCASSKSDQNLITVKFSQNDQVVPLTESPYELILQFSGNFSQLLTRNDTLPVCQYWNTAKSKWTSDGCRAINFTETSLTCGCNHTTDFSVTIALITPLIENIFSYQYAYTTVIAISILVPVSLAVLVVFVLVDWILVLACAKKKQKRDEGTTPLRRNEVPFNLIVKDEFFKTHLFCGLIWQSRFEEQHVARLQKWIVIVATELLQLAVTASLFSSNKSSDLYFVQFLSAVLFSNVIIFGSTWLFTSFFTFTAPIRSPSKQKQQDSSIQHFEREVLEKEDVMVLTHVKTPTADTNLEENYNQRTKVMLKLKRKLAVDLVDYMIPPSHIIVNLLVTLFSLIIYIAAVTLTCVLLHVSFGASWKASYSFILGWASFILLQVTWLMQITQDLYGKLPIIPSRLILGMVYSAVMAVASIIVMIIGIVLACTLSNWDVVECCIVSTVAAFIVLFVQFVWTGVMIALYCLPQFTTQLLTSHPSLMYYYHLPFYFRIYVYLLLSGIVILSIVISIYYGLAFTLMNAVLWICTAVVALILDIIFWKPLLVVAKGFCLVFLRRVLKDMQ